MCTLNMEDHQRLLADSKEDLEVEAPNDGAMTKRTRRPRLLWHTVLQVYLAILTTCVCILQVRILRLESSSSTVDRQNAVQKADTGLVELQFRRNESYMTLDHQYDELWDWRNHTYVMVPEPELDTEKQIPAAISM